MTSTSREVRREEYSTNVVRTLQPARPLSPYSQKSDFDNNLGESCSSAKPIFISFNDQLGSVPQITFSTICSKAYHDQAALWDSQRPTTRLVIEMFNS